MGVGGRPAKPETGFVELIWKSVNLLIRFSVLTCCVMKANFLAIEYLKLGKRRLIMDQEFRQSVHLIQHVRVESFGK